MDKLELKHLAPYLPYGLKCITTTNVMGDMVMLSNTEVFLDCEVKWDSGTPYNWMLSMDIKPILRPLSDIKDSEAHHDIYCNDPQECDFHIQSILNGITKSLPYWVIEILVENHFDVFGLIPAGLAISYKEAGL